MKIFERDKEENALLEGSRVIKHDGKYYLLMISWPRGGKRRQVCYRADKITGPYEKKVILVLREKREILVLLVLKGSKVLQVLLA
jgi:beta-xylosidase